ncbi:MULTISPECIES: hypothetical protein [Macrococcoides]|nr:MULTISPECIES: hypothetical protein [Macrococcus]PKE18454.1 hypothetical protein CW679_10890 [Macrococcus caseolyticus]QNR09078.1 hypothetical protein GL258_12395 [Macrococcus canis]
MDAIFEPIRNMGNDAISGFISLVSICAILGIIICALGATFGSEKSKEKFKSAFPWIIVAFVVALLARVIVTAVRGYF